MRPLLALPVLSAGASGLLFGLGLIVSGMVNPAKVIGFLDVAGRWDPSLALVMGAAVAISALGWAVARRQARPLLGPRFDVPPRRGVDARLMGGAVLFGVGWGLAGLCPGPALVALGLAPGEIAVFVAAAAAGTALVRIVPSDPRRPKAPPEADAP